MRNPFKKSQGYTPGVGNGTKEPLPDSDFETGVVKKKGDENEERGNWSNPIEFMLSLIGYAVGLGNLWRFPYLCMRNGGGAFLIPYFTFLLLCGIPLFYLEVAMGQFASASAISIWKVCPLFQGLGWGMIIVSGICALYYNTVIMWVFFYLGNSFTGHLPWSDCGHSWNTANCIRHVADSGNASLAAVQNSSSYSTLAVATPTPSTLATTVAAMVNASKTLNSPANEFWELKVLQRSGGIGEFDGIHWEMFACLVAAWVLVYLCLIKGIKSVGKVVYVTATLPYLLLFCLLIRGVTLPGAREGIMYYITPDVKRLMEFNTWAEACLQIFFSLGPAWGALMTMSSYNKFHHNCFRDAMVIPLVNCGTSFFAGFVIFSIIGFMSYESGLAIEEVIKSGPGLVFIAYPEAIARMPGATVWAILFFIMLLTLGLDTMFGLIETLVSGIVDRFPKLLRWKNYVCALVCFTSFLLAVPFCTRAGLYYFQIIDWYHAIFIVTLVGFLECIVLAWIYGWKNLSRDIEMMLGSPPSIVWRILWGFVTPTILLVVVCLSVQVEEPYYGDYTYPRWAISMGWGIGLISVIPLPVGMVLQILSEEGNLWERVKKSSRPAKDWGPALEKYKVAYEANIKLKNINHSLLTENPPTIIT